jgi:hypothetical protein
VDGGRNGREEGEVLRKFWSERYHSTTGWKYEDRAHRLSPLLISRCNVNTLHSLEFSTALAMAQGLFLD